jgi:hypothetical protein
MRIQAMSKKAKADRKALLKILDLKVRKDVKGGNTGFAKPTPPPPPHS